LIQLARPHPYAARLIAHGRPVMIAVPRFVI
jgi:hypothetical protein